MWSQTNGTVRIRCRVITGQGADRNVITTVQWTAARHLERHFHRHFHVAPAYGLIALPALCTLPRPGNELVRRTSGSISRRDCPGIPFILDKDEAH